MTSPAARRVPRKRTPNVRPQRQPIVTADKCSDGAPRPDRHSEAVQCLSVGCAGTSARRARGGGGPPQSCDVVVSLRQRVSLSHGVRRGCGHVERRRVLAGCHEGLAARVLDGVVPREPPEHRAELLRPRLGVGWVREVGANVPRRAVVALGDHSEFGRGGPERGDVGRGQRQSRARFAPRGWSSVVPERRTARAAAIYSARLWLRPAGMSQDALVSSDARLPDRAGGPRRPGRDRLGKAPRPRGPLSELPPPQPRGPQHLRAETRRPPRARRARAPPPARAPLLRRPENARRPRSARSRRASVREISIPHKS